MKFLFPILGLVATSAIAFPPEECPQGGQCVCAPHPAYATDCTQVQKGEGKSTVLSQIIMHHGVHL